MLGAMLIYVFFASVGTITGIGLIKGINYILAFCTTIYLLTIAGFSKNRIVINKFTLILFLYYYALIGSIAFNHSNVDWATFFKMLLCPAFLYIGIKFEAATNVKVWSDRRVRFGFYALILLPIFVWAIQLTLGRIHLSAGEEVSIFVNRNNAALYAITLFAFYSALSKNNANSIFLYILAGISFGTLGVLLAIGLSIFIAFFLNTKNIKLIISCIFLALTLVLVLLVNRFEIGLLSRVYPVIDTICYIWQGKIDIALVSYADLVRLMKTSDLSFIFRLKHWYELLNIYLNGSIYETVFGFGIGSSELFTERHLVPHNDYLRYLFECGLVTFIAFLVINIKIVLNCGRGWALVPFLVVTIYFVSENLIGNFLAMSIYYFSAGAMVQRNFLKQSEIGNVE
jgi:hypothetical protein